MKRFLFLIFLISGLLGFGRFAQAHFSQTSGSIAAELHVEPDDDPVIGRPASLLFDITDSQQRFKAADCDCAITINNGSRQLLVAALLPTGPGPSIFSLQIPYTFPQKGLYSIGVTGKPKIANAFQSFQLAYNLRVDRSSSLPTLTTLARLAHFDHPEHVAAFAIGIIVAYVFYKRDKRKLQLQQSVTKN